MSATYWAPSSPRRASTNAASASAPSALIAPVESSPEATARACPRQPRAVSAAAPRPSMSSRRPRNAMPTT